MQGPKDREELHFHNTKSIYKYRGECYTPIEGRIVKFWCITSEFAHFSLYK